MTSQALIIGLSWSNIEKQHRRLVTSILDKLMAANCEYRRIFIIHGQTTTQWLNNYKSMVKQLQRLSHTYLNSSVLLTTTNIAAPAICQVRGLLCSLPAHLQAVPQVT